MREVVVGEAAAGGLTDATTPESVGISSAAVLDFVDAIEEAGLDPHSLMLARHGRVAAAGWWWPYRPDDLTLLYSLSKSFTATAVGFAVAEGLLDLDGTLAGYFPGSAAGPLAGDIRVRHLLAMATGHELDTLGLIDPADPVGSFLAIEPDTAPGGLFTYNNGATLMLSALLTERTGQDVSDYLRPRLLRPLRIGPLFWLRTGRYQQGYSGLHLTTAAVARLGQTYLSDGRYAGRAVLPDGWAAQASAVHTANADRSPTVDWQQGYGFGFWRSRHGFRGDGAAGQFCLVVGEHDLVLAGTGAMDDMQAYLERVWSVLLPGVTGDGLRADPAVASRLTERLAGLSLPRPLPADGTDGPAGPTLSFRTAGDPAATLGLTGAEMQRRDAGWTLTLSEAVSGRIAGYTMPIAADRFVRTEHAVGDGVLTLAACGGWGQDGRFTADVVLVNTPHRFRLVADPWTGDAETAWHIAPLEPVPLSSRAITPTDGVPTGGVA